MAISVQDMCKKKGVSLLELVDRSGLDLLKVQSIFLDRWTPTPEERAKIAAAMNVAVDDMAWGHSTPIQHIYGHGPG